MLSLIQIKYIHQCQNTDHVYAIVRTSLQVTHMVRAGDLVPAGTVLVTPALAGSMTIETNSFETTDFYNAPSTSLWET